MLPNVLWSQQNNKKPNIVLIMADDIGLGDIGFYHKKRTGKKPVIPTPNIDKLAKKGMYFTDAHSPASLCAPTRFSMMTGNYSFRNKKAPWGAWHPEVDSGIMPEFTTIGHIAKQGGYTTAFFGKWGLGGVWKGYPKDYSHYEKTEISPADYGFEYSYQLPDGIQYHPYIYYENGNWVKLKSDSKLVHIAFEQTKYDKEWETRHRDGVGDSNWDPALAGPKLANKAEVYINNQKNRTKPFFLYYCSQAVHEPHTPPMKLGKTKIAGTTPSRHGDMIKELDAQVGKIIKALKKNGLYDNTLIVITSDNGGLKGEPYDQTPGHDASNGWMGQKADIYEGGHRVPFIAVWPGRIHKNSQSDVTIVGHDMVATLAAISNVPLDKSKVLDAVNLLPVFTKNETKVLHPYLVHQAASNKKPRYALREGDWKLILKTDKLDKWNTLVPIALYNLKNNKEEIDTYNLLNHHHQKERVKNMISRFKEVRIN
jgi:arylsulfatase A-like enzyme